MQDNQKIKTIEKLSSLIELLNSKGRKILSKRTRAVLRGTLFRIIDAFLMRWDHQIGLSTNYRAMISMNAGRKEIDSLERLYDFWLQEKPHGNFFSTPGWTPRSETIINALFLLISPEDSILEVGCNAGRNLNHLWQAGFHNLFGIEISHHAVRRLSEAYPSLSVVPIDIGPAEKVLKNHANNSHEIVFTMAVLEHIHPESKQIFSEIARVAKKYVLAIEPRVGHSSHRQYPWNIENEFLSVELKLIAKKPWIDLWPGDPTRANGWSEDYNNYDAFLFETQ